MIRRNTFDFFKYVLIITFTNLFFNFLIYGRFVRIFSELVTEEALKNRCKDCTEKQKKDAEKIMLFMKENKKDMWKQLEDKFDPQGIYRQRYIKNGKIVFT